METKTTCYIHPNRETVLRCNRCERYICSECAVLTPTGYRCKNCVKSQQKVFETTYNTATSVDLVVGPLVALVLSAIGSRIAEFFGLWGILIAIFFGWGIAELVRGAVRRRRSKLLFRLVGAALLMGSLMLPAGLVLLTGGHALASLFWPLVIAVVITATGYSNLRGNVIRV
jgi:hypothetical protein